MEAISAPKKRTSKSAARKGLEAAIAQFDELLSGDALTDKPAKKADLVIEKARALKELLTLEAEDRVTETQETIDRLEAQHTEDARHLTELKTENATLRTKASEVKTITVPDPEAAALRERNAALMSLLKSFAGKFDSEKKRIVAAFRAIKSSSPSIARLFCEVIGADYTALVQFLQTFKTEAQLNEIIVKAKQRGPAVIMAEAVIEVTDADTMANMNFVPVLPEKRDLEAESEAALNRVKATVGKVKLSVFPQPVRTDGRPRTAEENLAMQETAFVGTPDAQQRRERVMPVYPQSQQSRKPISGCAEGADFSEWV